MGRDPFDLTRFITAQNRVYTRVVVGNDSVFAKVLEKYYGGERDQKTLRIVT
ncbi:MAG: hypothetical protein JW969_14860 [Spirochaetales bacterium]|nr:hypothetical protein [Spirochaetales bacterium]